MFSGDISTWVRRVIDRAVKVVLQSCQKYPNNEMKLKRNSFKTVSKPCQNCFVSVSFCRADRPTQRRRSAGELNPLPRPLANPPCAPLYALYTSRNSPRKIRATALRSPKTNNGDVCCFMLYTGSILRYVRDCTSLKLDGPESCRIIGTPDDATGSHDDAGGKSRQPAKSCVWTCSWDGCNDAPLSTAAPSLTQHLLPLAATLFCTLIISHFIIATDDI